MQPKPLASLMPADDAVPGWSAVGDVQTFDTETLFRYANGGSEFFFLYGFEKMVVRSYMHESGTEMEVEIWQLATSDDAYGLFSQSGIEASIRMEDVADAALNTGTLLCFWQDRYYVLLRTTNVVPDSELIAFGEAISSALPVGGSRPGLLALLPANPVPDKPVVFFHEEMVIQDSLFLGGENILGLSQKTDAVLAQYQPGEETITIILIEYPDAGSASGAEEALRNNGVKSLLASRVASSYLSAAFGDAAGRADAETLLGALSIP